jgi:hypothetical protein
VSGLCFKAGIGQSCSWIFCVTILFPDKAMTLPSPGHESVSVSSILHDEKKSRAAAAG